MSKVVNIVGVGNTLMGDDGVGVVALERLAERGVPEGAQLHEAGLAVSDVLGRLDPDDPLIVLDGVEAGGPPGSVYKVHLDEASLEAAADERILSLHELSVVPALRLEALSGRRFSDVMVFGVEPSRVAWGEGLSPPVSAAIERLVDAVAEHVETRRRPRRPVGEGAGYLPSPLGETAGEV